MCGDLPRKTFPKVPSPITADGSHWNWMEVSDVNTDSPPVESTTNA